MTVFTDYPAVSPSETAFEHTKKRTFAFLFVSLILGIIVIGTVSCTTPLTSEHSHTADHTEASNEKKHHASLDWQQLAFAESKPSAFNQKYTASINWLKLHPRTKLQSPSERSSSDGTQTVAESEPKHHKSTTGEMNSQSDTPSPTETNPGNALSSKTNEPAERATNDTGTREEGSSESNTARSQKQIVKKPARKTLAYATSNQDQNKTKIRSATESKPEKKNASDQQTKQKSNQTSRANEPDTSDSKRNGTNSTIKNVSNNNPNQKIIIQDSSKQDQKPKPLGPMPVKTINWRE